MRRIAATLFTLTLCSTVSVFFSLSFLTSGAAETAEPTIKITAHKFAYEPNQIHLKLGEPVVLELTAQDVTHGFNIPELGLRADLKHGETVRVRLVPKKTGTFEFHCDHFCRIDHEDMNGTIIVE
jgi:cytochrome c oxidase subunit 2